MPNALTHSSDDPPTVNLRPRRIVLGITGGIAAYKAAELVRLFVKGGVEVTVVMTEAAKQFITPVTLQALSGNKVYTDLWDSEIPNNMAHIEISREADLILVAPATGDFLAKVAHGLANDLLSTLCLARNAGACPLLVAPAMNREMWDNPATNRNVEQLRADGVVVLGPAPGDQACGETGMGRMLEPEDLYQLTLEQLRLQDAQSSRESQPLAGQKVMVTAGPTFEAIDAVRGITNTSSGRMGYAIAEALRDRGATVVLVSGQTSLADPAGVRTIRVTSSSQMLDAVEANIDDIRLFFAVAAVADYRPDAPTAQKLKKTEANLTLSLVPTVDILARIAQRPNPPFCVGFAAESDNVVEYASKKRQSKRIPMIVANHANTAIGAASNEVTIIDEHGQHHVARAPKDVVARKVVDHAIQLFHQSAWRDANASATNITPIHASKHAAT
jgi:phosphopantothenoylcysteine decarboxylase / phosphopantothenate---cysteine ligase